MANRYRVASGCHGMILRSSTKSRFYWVSLPLEIRLLALEAIRDQKHPGWASFASVCKEWQHVIEKENFHRLKLEASCLNDFERMVIRQRKLVRHIWLDIELPKYSCRCCKRRESCTTSARHSSDISKAIWKLFRILSTWESENSLTLELNTYSPSDSEHWFKNYHFDDDGNEDTGNEAFSGEDAGNEDATSPKETDSSWHDPKHGWIHGQQVTAPPKSAILRLFESINYLPFKGELSRVEIVTCFIIRRQLRRLIVPSVLWTIFNHLPSLEHLIYEPWRECDSHWRAIYNRRMYRYYPESLHLIRLFDH